MRALFPASFDPVTNGHMDVLSRAARVFDTVVAGEAVAYSGLTVDFAREIGARVLVRGLRAVSDFEHEFALSAMNRRLHPDIDTMFFLSAPEHAFVSSSLIREIGAMGRSVEPFVPASVAVALRSKFCNHKIGGS